MQVLVTVIDDNGNSQTFQLEKVRDAPRFVRFDANERDDPRIGGLQSIVKLG